MQTRYACLKVPAFFAAAVRRSDPALWDHPLAVTTGHPPAVTVLDADARARRAGVRIGMSGAEAAARVPGLALRPRSPACEQSAQAVLLELALGLSPRIEDGGAGTVYLDLHGLTMLYRDERRLADDLAARVEHLGLGAAVAIASTRTAARLAASLILTRAPLERGEGEGEGEPGAGKRVVIPSGDEARFLAPLPVDLLDASPEIAQIFSRWGIRALGELAALPDAALIERLGDAGRRMQREARGEDLRPLIPYQPPTRYEEAIDVEWPIENLEALTFVLGGVVDRLMNRLVARGWAAAALRVVLGLTDRASREYALPFASPLAEGRAALPLLAQVVRSNPPPAAIERVSIQADPVIPRAAQGALFASATLSPDTLAATLARIEALVGPGHVGSPVLLESHRPEAFRMNPFLEDLHPRPLPISSPLVFRRFRPPPESVVETKDGCPIRIVSDRISGRIVVCAGPWRSSGEWWAETGWSRDEWDVEVDGGWLLRLAFDRVRETWFIEGMYD